MYIVSRKGQSVAIDTSTIAKVRMLPESGATCVAHANRGSSLNAFFSTIRKIKSLMTKAVKYTNRKIKEHS